MPCIDAIRDPRFEGLFLIQKVLLQQIERVDIARRFEILPQFHLFHQKIRRHRRIGLECDVHAVQFEQVFCALHRALERAVGLVHLRGPLHRGPALGFARVREAVRMDFRLDFTVRTVQ